jgi:hypothetical protein
VPPTSSQKFSELTVRMPNGDIRPVEIIERPETD